VRPVGVELHDDRAYVYTWDEAEELIAIIEPQVGREGTARARGEPGNCCLAVRGFGPSRREGESRVHTAERLGTMLVTQPATTPQGCSALSRHRIAGRATPENHTVPHSRH
jgi:hypothetical protein